MDAAQLIYTSWKNGESLDKGYMVYSRSADVTDAEAEEITAKMQYLALPDLPEVPTNEELALHPKNLSYFPLESGRYCLAQSSYIGLDYSGRSGNYMLHAYLFNLPIADAMSFLDADVFRTKLTEQEENAPFASPFLPHVELNAPPFCVGEKELTDYFHDRKKELATLVSAVLNYRRTKQPFYFYAEYAEIKYWFYALLHCCGKEALAAVSFFTFARKPQKSFALSMIHPDCFGFAYEEAVEEGKCVVQTADRLCSGEMSGYAALLTEALITGESVSGVTSHLAYLMKEYYCKEEEAISVFRWSNGLSELSDKAVFERLERIVNQPFFSKAMLYALVNRAPTNEFVWEYVKFKSIYYLNVRIFEINYKHDVRLRGFIVAMLGVAPSEHVYAEQFALAALNAMPTAFSSLSVLADLTGEDMTAVLSSNVVKTATMREFTRVYSLTKQRNAAALQRALLGWLSALSAEDNKLFLQQLKRQKADAATKEIVKLLSKRSKD